jgi:site-specific DNA-methyltransferase (adenine-specific)
LATESDLGLAGTGYDTDDLDDLLSRLGTSPDLDEPDGGIETPEGADELPSEVEALTKAGDVVQVGRHTLHCGDCIEVMRGLPDCSVDAIVTDPPYGISMMGKAWDCAVPGDDFASEAYRILRPGGHIVAFAATRTIHRLTVALEDAGLDIRDQICWLTWQGFPKSHDASKALDQHFGAEREVVGSYEVTRDLSGGSWADLHGKANGATMHSITAPATPEAQQWQGWGTALKPCSEPCVLARKPLEGTVAENLLKWGVGALNIDGCRYPYGDPAWPGPSDKFEAVEQGTMPQPMDWGNSRRAVVSHAHPEGRWPANVYHTPKASRSEREQGCDELPTVTGAQAVERQADTAGLNSPRAGAGRTATTVRNGHPTVKPVRLMQWLVRLVTPPGCTVLEPFAGSGTTLLACEIEGFDCIGIEMEPAYCDIVRARLTSWQAQTDHP